MIFSVKNHMRSAKVCLRLHQLPPLLLLKWLFLLQQINSDYFQDIGELDYYISNISLRSVQDF